MDYFMNDLKVRGSKGLHLELGIKNQRAFHFYKKYGMKELKRDRNSIIMGISFE
jgi:ribosomal protein S18 acetylase RimI-like enzyme